MKYNDNPIIPSTAICQSVVEVKGIGVALLGAESHRFNFFN